ncbi:hypothetical protein [Xenorhabdus ehlersii]|uniref:Uncharacterized protein n=1 Tax=Xenorhabdus ehlersii TaxID=290111 RepID=A0A2D0IKS4_9GAMM|nr:hypothetical protein [Xenorhabdus ehlersii]PHM22371.1 hypothetical protein Xehl_03715 [Xenorhabdus ehlersii]RKE90543.1 hypothetical protein BDE27_2417 [Xenorhabdus ehlersii]
MSIVMYDSPEAAKIKTVTGWVSRDGRFFGDDEHLARYCGATHRECDSNPDHPIIEINRSRCSTCYEESRQRIFMEMERKQWDRKTPLVLFDTEQYFWDADDLGEYCHEHEVDLSELQLVICEPNYPSEIDGADWFHDELPPDGELPYELQQAFDALNAIIRNSPPLSWSQGKYAAIVSD